MDEDDLLKLIHEAFGDVNHPGDEFLPSAQTCDDNEIHAFYGLQHWLDACEMDLAYHNAALNFFSPAGFRFFLPAFLVWVIRNFRSGGGFTVDSTIYALDLGVLCDRGKLSKLRALSPRQHHAVLAFLEHMAAAGDQWCDAEAAREAIDNLLRAGLIGPKNGGEERG